MNKPPTTIECPCYRVCSGLGVKLGRWCRYDTEAVPNPGMHRFDPQETWCPGGVQANVLMLAYMLSGEKRDAPRLQEALAQVREWAKTARSVPNEHGLSR